MKHLPHILTALLCSCSTTIEKMAKDGPEGDTYLFANMQWGSKMTVKTSMGTSLAVDSIESFIAFTQAMVAKWGFDAAVAQQLQSEITARVRSKEITERLGMQLSAAVATSTSENGLKLALAKIAAGR